MNRTGDRVPSSPQAAPDDAGSSGSKDAAETDKGPSIRVQPVSLPKAGRALTGVGGTLGVNPFDGSAPLSIPFETSACRECEPHLALDYAAAAGAGIFGLGFRLSLPSIARRTATGVPRYDDSDVFTYLGQPLVAVTETNRRTGDGDWRITGYQPRREQAFERIERWTAAGTGDSHWRIIERDGVVRLFGLSAEARVADPDDAARVFEWLIERQADPRGNAVWYQWKRENDEGVPDVLYERNRVQDANRYPERVRYGNATPLGVSGDWNAASWHFLILFDYGEYDLAPSNPAPCRPVRPWPARLDPFSTYTAGFERRTHRLCHALLMVHHFPDELGPDPVLVRAMGLEYQQDESLSQLSGVTLTGYHYRPGQPPETRALPKLELTYSAFSPAGRAFVPMAGDRGRSLPAVRHPPLWTLADLHGDGLPGVLYADGHSVLYRAPAGCGDGDGAPLRYDAPEQAGRFPIARDIGETAVLTDVDGDGRLELVCAAGGQQGYYAPRIEGGWQSFRPFADVPTEPVDGFDAVNLSATGRNDLVRIDPDLIRWYPSRGDRGFAPARRRVSTERVPTATAASDRVLIGFADVLGAGAAQRVRVTDGLVECWPSLGHGRFGAKVVLGGAPHLGAEMKADRLHLVDIDGSGAADLAVVHSDRVEIHFNRSGNSFAPDPLTIPLPRRCRAADQVFFADVTGSGSRCLVFIDDSADPRQWVLDFCGGALPYLLVGADEGTGRRTAITHTPSTRFWLRDKEAGRPWVSRLPLPVPLVETVEQHDLVNGRVLTSRFAYHDGHYDPVERRFLGFAMVERRDSQSAAGTLEGPVTLTRAWFVNGDWRNAGPLARKMTEESWNGDSGARPAVAPAIVGTAPLSEETLRQAWIALAGAPLREELSGLDSDNEAATSAIPSRVVQYGHEARVIRSAAPDSAAPGSGSIVFVHQREKLDYIYEGRLPADPRVDHALVLEVDDHGLPRREAEIAYVRRDGGADTVPEQRALSGTATVTAYEPVLDDPDRLLFGLEGGRTVFDLAGLTPPAGQTYFDIVTARRAVDAALATAPRLDVRRWIWQAENGAPAPQKLLLSADRAACEASQVTALFAGVAVPGGLDAFLSETCGYTLDDGLWWIPGERASYAGGGGFFLRRSVASPLAARPGAGSVTAYDYDAYGLVLRATTVTADGLRPDRTEVTVIDYRTLSARQVTDANGLVSEVLTDPLGAVIATSRRGQEMAEDGTIHTVGFEPLDDSRPLPRPVSTDDVLADPAAWLNGAESRRFPNLACWRAEGEPVHELVLTASDYPDSLGHAVGAVGIVLTHEDGLGREVQKAQRVEPGEALLPQPDGGLKPGPTTSRWQIDPRQSRGGEDRVMLDFQPFFLSTWRFLAERTLAPAVPARASHYDALARVVRVDLPKDGMPDAFFTLTVRGPWSSDAWDADDTVTRSPYYRRHIDDPNFPPLARQALTKAAALADTPATRIMGPHGRAVRDIVRLSPDGSGGEPPLVSHTGYDALGRIVAKTDPRLGPKGILNLVNVHGLGELTLQTHDVDSGTRWILTNADDKRVLVADGRGTVVVHRYDGRQRPAQVSVFDGAEAARTALWTIYGDSLDSTDRPPLSPDGRNLSGRICLLWDEAGLTSVPCRGLDGKPLRTARRFTADPRRAADWQSDPAAPWAARFAALEAQLDAETFSTVDSYDGAGRVVRHHNEIGETVRHGYDVAGRMDKIWLTPTEGGPERVILLDAAYDAAGHRQTAAMADPSGGVLMVTTSERDPDSGLVAREYTRRVSDDVLVHSLRYVRDPVGNVTHIANESDGALVVSAASVSPDRDLTYDAAYRLIEARGRAHLALTRADLRSGRYDGVFQAGRSLNDATAVEACRLAYAYDAGGNIASERYMAGADGGTRWTRTMTVAAESNRAVDEGGLDGAFDANGNQIRLSGLGPLGWDWRDRLHRVVLVARPDGEPDAQYIARGADGRRMRRSTRRLVGGWMEQRDTLFFDGLEVTRLRRADTLIEDVRRTRLQDGDICLAERLSWAAGSAPDGVIAPQMRLPLTDHQRSIAAELDDAGKLLSWEEYGPFGTTLFALGPSLAEVSLRHHRFCGKDRDTASGLYDFGARCYAPWLGRWLSPDPAGPVDGLNLYAYCSDNPVTRSDPTGLCSGGDRPKRSSWLAPTAIALGGFWLFSGVRAALRGQFRSWFNFRGDRGGVTSARRIGNLLGIWPRYSPNIRNFDIRGTPGHIDTAAHEGFHSLVFRFAGPWAWLGNLRIGRVPVGAPFVYVEEVFAYAIGHLASGRLHGIPFAPLEAFGSLSRPQVGVTLVVLAFTLLGTAYATISGRREQQRDK